MAKAHALYGAVTGYLPVSRSFGFTGKVGVSYGTVTGNSVLGTTDALTGSNRSAMYGLGAQYTLSQRTVLTLDYDHYVKVSDKVTASAIRFGARMAF